MRRKVKAKKKATSSSIDLHQLCSVHSKEAHLFPRLTAERQADKTDGSKLFVRFTNPDPLAWHRSAHCSSRFGRKKKKKSGLAAGGFPCLPTCSAKKNGPSAVKTGKRHQVLSCTARASACSPRDALRGATTVRQQKPCKNQSSRRLPLCTTS